MTHPKLLLAVAFCSFALSATALAQSSQPSLDPANEQALKQTQDLLKNAKAREASMTAPEAKNADANLKNLMGPDTQGAYELAADVLAVFVRESGGDSRKLQETMTQFMQNPDSFKSRLTPEQLKRLKDLADRVESRQPSGTAPH